MNNSDKIISTSIGIAKAFAAIKISSGAIKGLDGIITLVKNLNTIRKAAGGAKVLQGAVGTFTGLGTTMSGALAGISAGMLPVLGIAGAIAAAGFTAYKIWDKTVNHWADGVDKASLKATEHANKIQELYNYQKEFGDLELVINSSDSSAAEINNAKSRIEEIASLLSEEYGLTIRTDDTNLDQTLGKVQEVVKGLSKAEHSNLENSAKNYISETDKAFKDYDMARNNLGMYQNNVDTLSGKTDIYKSLKDDLNLANGLYEINGSIQEYKASVYEALSEMSKNGLRGEFEKIVSENGSLSQYGLQNLDAANFDDIDTLGAFSAAMQYVWMESENQYNSAQEQLNSATDNINKYETAADNALNSMAQALQSDVLNGNTEFIQNDIELFNTLYKHMNEVGANTDNIVGKFALAKNGFAEAMEATAKGGDAINNIIADMKLFGDSQGLFDGITTPDGIVDKLSDIAHTMQLIPENKSITLDAKGNFSVIEEAENQIASLKSIGNVDVSVNANGDFSILNEVTGDIHTLQGMGAVALEINAEGNIDVLNKAGEVIANIDSKNAQVDINGIFASIKESFDLAKRTAEEQLGNNTITVDTTVQGGTLNIEPLKTFILLSKKSIFGKNAQATQSVNVSLNTTDNATPNLQSVKKAVEDIPLQHSTNLTAFGNAYLKVTNLYEKLKKLPNSKDITINIKTNGETPRLEKGVKNAVGGVYMVNDQSISDPREVIEYKDTRYWFEGRNILTTLPSGANVYTAAQSRAFINGSHKNGLDRVPFDGYIAELHKGEQVLTADEASDYSGGTFGDILDRLNEMLDELRGGIRSRSGERNNGGVQIAFSPQITVNGNGDKETIMTTIRMSYSEFKEFIEEYERDRRRKVF